jgi:hypothetical protein
VCYIVPMKLIDKPEAGNWPDILKLKVHGVPAVIDYKSDMVMVPDSAKHMQDNLAAYLIDEGFIKIKN